MGSPEGRNSPLQMQEDRKTQVLEGRNLLLLQECRKTEALEGKCPLVQECKKTEAQAGRDVEKSGKCRWVVCGDACVLWVAAVCLCAWDGRADGTLLPWERT